MSISSAENTKRNARSKRNHSENGRNHDRMVVGVRELSRDKCSSEVECAHRRAVAGDFVSIKAVLFCLIQVRQKGVVRKPAHVHNYVHNAQMVVDALAGPILNMDLSHITGEAIVRGDTLAIR